MSDVAVKQNTDVAMTGSDPYAAYGAKVGTIGQFLSFKNGEYLFGQNAEELPIGTKLIANMPGLRIGWRRWFANQVEDLTEPLNESPVIKRREDLGDNDKALWECDKPTPKDPNPQPRDPWQFTNIIELSSGENVYIFSTGSKGGIGAIGRLCKAYGQERRMRPGMLPIVALARDSYNHKEFGKTYVPEFPIVGWTDENAPSVDDVSDDDIPFENPNPRLSGKDEPKKTRF